MVDVCTSDGTQRMSVMLQNAETVKLVGPAAAAAAEGLQGKGTLSQPLSSSNATAAQLSSQVTRGSNGSSSSSNQGSDNGGSNGTSNGTSMSSSNGSSTSAVPAHSVGSESKARKPSGRRWQTLSVSGIKPGDQVYVYRPQSAARHMGHAINEFIHEK